MASLAAVKPIKSAVLKAAKPGETIAKKQPVSLSAGEEAPPPPAAGSLAQKEKEIDFTRPDIMYDFVLYCHARSRPAMEVIDFLEQDHNKHLKSKIWFQNVADLSKDELGSSPWLSGVPLLVNRRNQEGFKGRQAVLDAIEKISPSYHVPQALGGGGGGSSVPPGFGVVRN